MKDSHKERGHLLAGSNNNFIRDCEFTKLVQRRWYPEVII